MCFGVCGDGYIRADEQCEDEDLDDGDGCSSSCMFEDGWNHE